MLLNSLLVDSKLLSALVSRKYAALFSSSVAAAHDPAASTSKNGSSTNLASSQLLAVQTKNLVPSGSGTPTKDGSNVYLSCPVCKQSFASNRCAAHLAKCMGVSNGSRRGARTVKNRVDERAASPYVDLSDDVVMASQKSKSKKKDTNGNGKRPPSPSLLDTPAKKLKKQKTGSFTETADTMSISSSQPPSSLRKSSTASSTAAFASPSPSASAFSENSAGSTTDSMPSIPGHASSKPSGKKKSKTLTGVLVPRGGPPGSSKGRTIAAARLHGEEGLS